MKLAKFAFICAAAVSVSAVADDVSNEIAILPVAKTLNAMPLTVNFTDAEGHALSASNIVKTAGLPTTGTGSALYVYDKDNNQYTKYNLSGTAWVPSNDGKTYVVNDRGELEVGDADAASDVSVARGAAVFLQTPSEFANNSLIYVAGTPATETTTTVSQGANLIGAPKAAEFDLNGAGVTWGDTANPEGGNAISNTVFIANTPIIKSKGDMIQVPMTNGGMSRIYYFNGEDWVYNKWESDKNKTPEFISTGCTIPAGCGFWYIRKAAADMTIVW